MFKSKYRKSLEKAGSLAVVPVVSSAGVLIEKLASGDQNAVAASMGMLGISAVSELLFDYVLPTFNHDDALVQTEHMVLEPAFNALAFAVYDSSFHPNRTISENKGAFGRSAVVGGLSTIGGVYAKAFADPLLRQ